MKRAIKAFSVFAAFIIMFLTASCVTTLKSIPEKYNFDNKLEKVERIVTFKSPTWEKLDTQAVIFKAAFNDNYLLILQRPISNVHLKIGIPGTGSTITAGHDRVVVTENTGPMFYTIDKIYRIKDKEQLKELRELLKIKN